MVRSFHTKGGPRRRAKTQPGGRILEQEEETQVKVEKGTMWTGGAGLSLDKMREEAEPGELAGRKPEQMRCQDPGRRRV